MLLILQLICNIYSDRSVFFTYAYVDAYVYYRMRSCPYVRVCVCVCFAYAWDLKMNLEHKWKIRIRALYGYECAYGYTHTRIVKNTLRALYRKVRKTSTCLCRKMFSFFLENNKIRVKKQKQCFCFFVFTS